MHPAPVEPRDPRPSRNTTRGNARAGWAAPALVLATLLGLAACGSPGPAPGTRPSVQLTVPTLAEALAGDTFGGLQLDQPLPYLVALGPGVESAAGNGAFALHHPGTGADGARVGSRAINPGLRSIASFAYQHTDRPGSAIAAELLYYNTRTGANLALAVAYRPNWRSDAGPQHPDAQLQLLGLSLGEFIGWSSTYGALHRSDRPGLLIGLEQDGAGDLRRRRVGTLVRIVRDVANVDQRKARGFASLETQFFTRPYVSQFTPLARAQAWADELIARGQLRTLRQEWPRPLPGGAAGEAWLARLAPGFAPLRRAVAAVPEPAAVVQAAGPAALDALVANVRELHAAAAAFGEGDADIPQDLRDGLARRLRSHAAELQRLAAAAPTAAERLVLQAMARHALAQAPRAADLAHTLDAAVLAPRFATVARDIDAADLVPRAEAFGALRDITGEPGVPAEVLADLEGLAQPRQQALRAELEGAARAHEQRGLPATAAGYWLLSRHTLSPAERRHSRTSAAGWPQERGADAFAQARWLVAGLYADTVPRFPAEKLAQPDRAWTARRRLDLAIEDAPGLQACTVEAGPLRYAGNFQWASTRVAGKPTGRYVQRTVEPAQTRAAWEREVQAKRSEVAALEQAAEPSNEALGTLMKGAAPGVRTYSSRGKISEFVVDRQAIYQIGVKEAADLQARRMQQAKDRLPLARATLDNMLKRGPAPARTATEWVPDGGREPDGEIRWRDWQGQATRALSARCPGAVDTTAFPAEQVFQASEHANPKLKHVPARGFDTAEALLSAMARNDQAERPAALTALTQAVVQGRIAAWRNAASAASPDEAGVEAAWRRWFLGVETAAPALLFF